MCYGRIHTSWGENKAVGNLEPGRGGGGTLLFGLYGDVPLDRVWFLALLS